MILSKRAFINKIYECHGVRININVPRHTRIKVPEDIFQRVSEAITVNDFLEYISKRISLKEGNIHGGKQTCKKAHKKAHD